MKTKSNVQTLGLLCLLLGSVLPATAQNVSSLTQSASSGYTHYSFNVTAVNTTTYLSFFFRQDPSYWGFDDISFTGSNGVNLVSNGGFETGSYSSWSLVGQQGLGAAGRVASGSPNSYYYGNPHSGNYWWYDGSVGGWDGIAQAVSTTPGQQYTLSYYLGGGGGYYPQVSFDAFVGPQISTLQGTWANQVSQGAVSGGTVTAGSGQQVNVTTASGGTIDSSAGTAQVDTLAGSTLNTGGYGATVSTLSSGTVNTSGGAVTTQGGNFTGSVTGTGSLNMNGSGTLTLNSTSSYSGGTTVSSGTVQAATSSALGSAPIRIINNGRFRAMSGVAVTNSVYVGSSSAVYEQVFSSGQSLSNYGGIRESFTGNNLDCFLPAGDVFSDATLASHINADGTLHIDGLDGTTFMLVMQMDGRIPAGSTPDLYYLGWLDLNDNTWKRATLGDHGADGSLAGGYSMSYQNFLSSNGGWNRTNMLGAYGVDTVNDQVWAVIDHNSTFGVALDGQVVLVPEPSTYALFGFSALALVIAARRKIS